jgi:hypothetical protein
MNTNTRSSSHAAYQDIRTHTSSRTRHVGFRARSIFSLAFATVALSLPGLLSAQAQPPVADNNQDEVINLSRAVDAGTDNFRILRSGDKAELNRYVSKAYRLKNANPYEILPYIRGAATLEKGSVATVWNPAAVDGPIALLQVNVPEFQLPYFDALVAAYDVKDFTSSAGDIKFSYRTKYRSAVEVAAFIKSSTLSGDGAISGDAATNTIYVSDSPSDFRRVIAQIQFYDIPVPQLDLEISVIELTDLDQTSLGLDWDAWKTSLSGKFDVRSAKSMMDSDPGADLDTYSRGYDGMLSVDATALAKFLNYLTDTGKAEVRARTNLTVSNGTVAVLNSSTQIPEFQYVYAAAPGKSNLTETAPQAGDPSSEGLTIRIAPVIAMNAARMDVDLTLRSPVGVSKTGAPIYSDQRVGANLTLEQDELYKMGGLRRAVMTKERKGFPLLKEIPVIKYLFSNETTIKRETELYVFLRPTWSAPMLPVTDAMQGDNPITASKVEQILSANPNISISAQDAELLSQYFDSQNGSGQ